MRPQLTARAEAREAPISLGMLPSVPSPTGPGLSLVLVCRPATERRDALGRLAGECARRGMELVIVSAERLDMPSVSGVASVRVVLVPDDLGAAQARERGFAAARGAIIMVAESETAIDFSRFDRFGHSTTASVGVVARATAAPSPREVPVLAARRSVAAAPEVPLGLTGTAG